MEKLELKHLAGYLPYGLKCEILNFKCDYVGEKYGIINGYYLINNEPHYTFKDRSTAGKDAALIKPILRPLSNLTKYIDCPEVMGEKIVPLLELRSIEQGNWDDGVFLPDNTQITDYGVRDGDSPCYWVEWKDGLNQTQSFSFKNGDFNRIWIVDRHKFGGLDVAILNNQPLLFQKLYEWHFDIHGLIEKGLAIDINTCPDF